MAERHICTCGDCSPGFDDRCQHEARLAGLQAVADELAYLLNGADGSTGYTENAQETIRRYVAATGRDSLPIPEKYAWPATRGKDDA